MEPKRLVCGLLISITQKVNKACFGPFSVSYIQEKTWFLFTYFLVIILTKTHDNCIVQPLNQALVFLGCLMS